MRSPAEIQFRLRQEWANLRLFTRPPSWGEPLTGPLPGFPYELPEGSTCRKEIERLAEDALRHRFHLLGLEPVDLGENIRWRRDFVHGKETGLDYFRRIPYLDFARAGDHKIIWELNRHQHLVVLAQAFLFTGRHDFLDEIPCQLDQWIAENPTQCGINWSSALEVAFRALSWLWVLHLVGRNFPEEFRRRWMRSLHHHGLHLEHNLSFYFSPNTHLLGEAVVLDALGTLLPQMPGAARWRELGTATVREQMRRQVRDDGSHFEQSSYYHVYAVDFFDLHARLHTDIPEWYRAKLAKMVEFRDALISTKGLLPLIGDDDGGRLVHPYGDRRRFGIPVYGGMRCPHNGSQLFPDAGLAVLRAGRAHVIFDVGLFGGGSAGHSHADTLSLVVFLDGEELLIDAGTHTYIADPEARQRFRGTTAHNTVSIDSIEQAEPQGPFRWANPPQVKLLHWSSNELRDIVDAHCCYRGFEHRRTVIFRKPDVLVVLDRVSGPGPHVVEQRWLMPEGANADWLATHPAAMMEDAERSCALGSKQKAVRWVARSSAKLPTNIVAVMRFDGGRAEIREIIGADDIRVVWNDGEAWFPREGCPRL